MGAHGKGTHDPLIINLASTGMVPTKGDNPAVPLTPDEIAADCIRCYRAGASVFHIHARDEAGEATFRGDVFREIVTGLRRSCPDAVVCVTTSGRRFRSFKERAESLDLDGEAKPDLASLTLGSMNFPGQASVNDPAMIKGLAEAMGERGIVPELEVFDLGMIDYAKYLIGRGVLREPFYFNLLLGSLGTLSASPFHLATLAMSLPAGAVWGAAGIGRFQFPMNKLAIAMGGHVRVGLEDNLHMDPDRTQLATNLMLVERLVRLAHASERSVATAAESRRLIGLRDGPPCPAT